MDRDTYAYEYREVHDYFIIHVTGELVFQKILNSFANLIGDKRKKSNTTNILWWFYKAVLNKEFDHAYALDCTNKLAPFSHKGRSAIVIDVADKEVEDIADFLKTISSLKLGRDVRTFNTTKEAEFWFSVPI